MLPDEVTVEKVNAWRAKVQDRSITVEEMREVIAFLRGKREPAVAAASAPGSKTRARSSKKAAVDSDALLDELKDL